MTCEGAILAASAMLTSAGVCAWVIGAVLLVIVGGAAAAAGIAMLAALAVGFFLFSAWLLS